jgi:heat shock protein HtpX
MVNTSAHGVAAFSVAAFGIAGGVGAWFATHPPLEERIAALQAAQL